MKQVIIILGPQGSGKGTQSALVADKLGLIHINMGEIFRQIAKEPSELGKQIQGIIMSGKYVNDDITMKTLIVELRKHEHAKGFVFDGNPRNLNQAKILISHLNRSGISNFTVFEIILSEEEIMKRLLLRKRIDDTPELIKARLKQHNDLFAPMAEYLKEQATRYYVIEGNDTIENISKTISGKLENGSD